MAWGGAHRPLSLTPQFFTHTPLDLLWRPGGRAELFHRFQLGRTLEEVQAYGCERWLSELALAGWAQERLEQRFHPLDTTSVALRGNAGSASDQPAMALTHGDAKDHRPDLQQVVVARLVSQDGGVPLGSKRGDGLTSDTPICQARAEARMAALARSPTPRSLGAEATLSTEDTAATRAQLGGIPCMPGTLTLVSQGMTQALQGDRWRRLDETTRSDGLAVWHYGMAQRWLVVSSQAVMARAEARITKAQPRAWEAIDKPLVHVQATRCETSEAAQAALQALAPAWRSHPRAASPVIAHKHYAGKGRPTPTRPRKAMAWQMHAQVRPAPEVMEAHKPPRACVVIGTHIPACHMREAAVLRASKAQSGVEGGVRLRKAPLCFVSSLCVKNPRRMHGFLTVMTLALLVYALTQRRWRQP